MTNGMGPMPIANDLHTQCIASEPARMQRREVDPDYETHATKVRMVTLASATMPEFNPKPTPVSDTIAPAADIDSSVLRPKR